MKLRNHEDTNDTKTHEVFFLLDCFVLFVSFRDFVVS